MAITYPLSLPSGPRGSSYRFAARDVVAMSASPYTGQQQIQQHAGQWWTLSVALPPMLRARAEEWIAFLFSLKGLAGTFLVGDPAGATPRGAGTGTPLVNGGSQAGGTLVLDGATPSITNWLRAGDYVQLGSGATARLHKVLKDVNSDGSGNVSLDLWPDLRSSPADNAALTLTNTVGLFRLAQNERGFDVGLAQVYGLAFQAIEAI